MIDGVEKNIARENGKHPSTKVGHTSNKAACKRHLRSFWVVYLPHYLALFMYLQFFLPIQSFMMIT